MLISNCCGEPIIDDDYDICPACGEHCEIVDEEQPENDLFDFKAKHP